MVKTREEAEEWIRTHPPTRRRPSTSCAGCEARTFEATWRRGAFWCPLCDRFRHPDDGRSEDSYRDWLTTQEGNMTAGRLDDPRRETAKAALSIYDTYITAMEYTISVARSCWRVYGYRGDQFPGRWETSIGGVGELYGPYDDPQDAMTVAIMQNRLLYVEGRRRQLARERAQQHGK